MSKIIQTAILIILLITCAGFAVKIIHQNSVIAAQEKEILQVEQQLNAWIEQDMRGGKEFDYGR